MPPDLDRYACDDPFPRPAGRAPHPARDRAHAARPQGPPRAHRGVRGISARHAGGRRRWPARTRCTPWDATRGGVAQGGRGADGVLRRARPRRRAGQVPLHASAGALETVDIVADLPGVRPVDESIIRNVARPPPSHSCARRRTGGRPTWTSPPAGGTAWPSPAWTKRPSASIATRRWPSSPPCSSSASKSRAPHRAGRRGRPGRRLRGPGPDRLGARVLAATPGRAGRVGLFGGGEGRRRAGGRRRLRPPAEADALVLCPADPAARTVGPGAPDGRGAPRGGRAAPRRGGWSGRERPAGARFRRPALPAGRRPRRRPRAPAAGRHRAARRRPQGRPR